jgi:hypothetical protein
MNTSNKEESLKKPVSRREKWRHAFAIGPEYEERITEEDEEIIDAFARAIVKRGLAAPATLWFVTLKPLSFLGASALQAGQFLFKDLAFEEFIKQHFMPSFEHAAFVKVLEKRKAVDKLIDLIEEHELEAKAQRIKERKERKEEKQKKKQSPKQK